MPPKRINIPAPPPPPPLASIMPSLTCSVSPSDLTGFDVAINDDKPAVIPLQDNQSDDSESDSKPTPKIKILSRDEYKNKKAEYEAATARKKTKEQQSEVRQRKNKAKPVELSTEEAAEKAARESKRQLGVFIKTNCIKDAIYAAAKGDDIMGDFQEATLSGLVNTFKEFSKANPKLALAPVAETIAQDEDTIDYMKTKYRDCRADKNNEVKDLINTNCPKATKKPYVAALFAGRRTGPAAKVRKIVDGDQTVEKKIGTNGKQPDSTILLDAELTEWHKGITADLISSVKKRIKTDEDNRDMLSEVLEDLKSKTSVLIAMEQFFKCLKPELYETASDRAYCRVFLESIWNGKPHHQLWEAYRDELIGNESQAQIEKAPASIKDLFVAGEDSSSDFDG